MTKGTGFPLKMVLLRRRPDKIATTIPSTYRANITIPPCFGKKAMVIMP